MAQQPDIVPWSPCFSPGLRIYDPGDRVAQLLQQAMGSSGTRLRHYLTVIVNTASPCGDLKSHVHIIQFYVIVLIQEAQIPNILLATIHVGLCKFCSSRIPLSVQRLDWG
jgi:hypothetical protein